MARISAALGIDGPPRTLRVGMDGDDVALVFFDELAVQRRAKAKRIFGETVWAEFERAGFVKMPTNPRVGAEDWSVSLTHSTYPGVKYQVTRWDPEGPFGHLDATSKQSAIDEMWYWAGGKQWRERWEQR